MKLYGYELSDPLVKRLKSNRRKKALVAKVKRVKTTEKQLVSDYENLLVGGRHSQKDIDDAKARVAVKRALRGMGY